GGRRPAARTYRRSYRPRADEALIHFEILRQVTSLGLDCRHDRRRPVIDEGHTGDVLGEVSEPAPAPELQRCPVAKTCPDRGLSVGRDRVEPRMAEPYRGVKDELPLGVGDG